jgi:Tuberculosis necrotizing toxin
VSVAQPTQLTPTEQDALVKQIGLAMLRVAPDDWEQLTVDYRSVGRYSEAAGQVVFSDGTSEPWTMPTDLQGLFARLRGGMYREGRGTWFNARYRLDHPSSYNLEYDREEPRWDNPPPPQAYPDDMRLFPRTEDNVPAWLRRWLSSAPPPRFRVARIFDGPPVDGGRPAVNRPPVDPDDIADLLKYLDNAPVVGPGRGFDIDRFDPDSRPSVPIAFHTDGTWIWPAAVNYYLREHDVPPEPDLVEHVMRAGFRPPLVEDSTRAAAAAFLGQGAGPGPVGPGPAGPGGPGGPGGPPRVPPPPPPAGPAPTRAMPVPPAPQQAPPQVPQQAPPPAAPPQAALPSSGPPGRTVDALRSRLDELGIPPTAYRIGPPAPRTWSMEQTEDGWRVGWFDREFVAPAMFEDVADASAFLLGKVLLDADRWQAAPGSPGLPVPPAPVPPPAENPSDFALSKDPVDAFAPPPAQTVVSPPVDLPRREPAKRPDSPEPAFDYDRADAPSDARARFNGAAMSTFDLPGPGGSPDSPFARSDRADKPFERTRSESMFEPVRPEPMFEQDFESRHAETGVEPAQPDQGEPRHSEPARSESGFEPAQAFEPRRHESSRPDHGFESSRPDHGFESRHVEPARSESGFEPRHSEFEARHAESGLEPTRSEPVFEPRRPEPALSESPFETRHSDPVPSEPSGFEARRPEPSYEPARSEFEARRPEPAMDQEPSFEPRRAGRSDSLEATRVDQALSGSFRADQARRDSPTAVAAPPMRTAAAAGSGSAAAANQEWPISPLPGEPPLTLFRGKRLMELEPGTEFDRFGGAEGNLTYALGTPFHQRSLVPEWVDRPYHAYRVLEPVQVLTGSAIPWFDQPGGGTAYLLPEAIGELLATGRIVELNGRERPPA